MMQLDPRYHSTGNQAQWHLPSTILPFFVCAKVTRVLAVVVVEPYSSAAHPQSSSGATLVARVFASSTKSRAAGGQTGISHVSFSWSGDGSIVKHQGLSSDPSGLRQ